MGGGGCEERKEKKKGKENKALVLLSGYLKNLGQIGQMKLLIGAFSKIMKFY